MGGPWGRRCVRNLLSRSQLLHMVQQRLCLIRCYSLFAIGRHVGRLLGFLALQYYVDVLLVSQSRVELLLGLWPVAGDAFGLVKGSRVRWLWFTLGQSQAVEDDAE